MLNFRPFGIAWRPGLVVVIAMGWLNAGRLAAQVLETPSIVHHVEGSHDRIDMVVNSSRHLVMDNKIPQAQVGNPEILAVTPLSANKIQISAKKPGVTQVNLWDEKNEVHTIDVVVFADAQELTLLLKTQFPKASLRVIPLANSVLISGYVDDPDEITHITEIAQDYHPKVINQVTVGGVQQVLLYVRVMEVSRSDLRNLGVDFGIFNSNDFFVSGISGLIQSASSQTQQITAAGQQLTLGIFNSSNHFNGFLQALRQNDLLKIVAEPNLVCVSGRPAFFNVGGEFPILVPQSLGTVSIQYKKFGTQLDFVPIVLGNNRIRLEVRPRISEIDPTRSVTINGTTVPGLRVREVETGVEMRAGETLAIAGLIQQRTEMQKRGWPFFGDLPYVGVFFRSVHSQVSEIETLVLVTPQFVEAMDVCEVPPGGPGLGSCPPNHRQLYCGGHIEVPCNCNQGFKTQIPGYEPEMMGPMLEGPPPGFVPPGAIMEGGPVFQPSQMIQQPPAEQVPAPHAKSEPAASASRARINIPSSQSSPPARVSTKPSPAAAAHARSLPGPIVRGLPDSSIPSAQPAASSPPAATGRQFHPQKVTGPAVQPATSRRAAPTGKSAPGLIGPAGYAQPTP